MKNNSEAHEALHILFQRYGVPPWTIVDGLKEQVEGEFGRKCKEAGCELKQTESYYL